MDAGRDDYDNGIRTRAIPDDEPRFILRGQDAAAADAVRHWAATSLAAGVPRAVVEQALRVADRMEAWPVKKLADADHLDEPARIALEDALAQRAWTAEPTAPDTARAIREAEVRSEGFKAGVRSCDAPMRRLELQVEALRKEVAAAEAIALEAKRALQAHEDHIASLVREYEAKAAAARALV